MASGGASPLNLATVCLPANAAFGYGVSAGMMLVTQTIRGYSGLFTWRNAQQAANPSRTVKNTPYYFQVISPHKRGCGCQGVNVSMQ